MKFLKIITFLLFLSCVKKTEILVPETPPSLVVKSYLKPFSFLSNNKIEFELQSTTSLNDTAIKRYISDATILYFRNDIIQDTLSYVSDGKYNIIPTLGSFPVAGDKYSIKITHPNFKETTSETVIPAKITVKDTGFIPISYVDEFNTAHAKISVTFDDPIGENYYEIALAGIAGTSFYQISSSNSIITSESYYPNILNNFNRNFPKSLLFKDNTFEGKEITIDFLHGGVTYPIILSLNPKYKLFLRNVSKEYYTYKTTLYRHVKSLKPDILYGVGEPLKVTSNIKNGYGIFAGYNETIIPFELKYL